MSKETPVRYPPEAPGVSGYVAVNPKTAKQFDIEFINDAWFNIRTTKEGYATGKNLRVPQINEYGLGYWRTDNPQHPKAKAKENIPQIITEPSTSKETMATAPDTIFPDTTTETMRIQTAEVDNDTQVVATTERNTQGSLKGNPPKVFDGTRADSENFVQDFKIYWKINRRNAIMDEPYSWIIMALSYIKGEKVKDWVATQLDLLNEKIQDGVLYSDKRLWAVFDKVFADAFTNITKEQDAYSTLKDLRMVGEDLDTFIATHGNLIH